MHMTVITVNNIILSISFESWQWGMMYQLPAVVKCRGKA